jgi:2'-5' RNA ligase
MRLFLGTELSTAVTTAAGAAADRLRLDIARAAPQAKLRWIPVENLHITLWFFGEVTEPQLDSLRRVLHGVDVSAFDLQVAGAGTFPSSGPPRVIWLGLPRGRDGLLAVYDRLRDRLMPLGFEPENRPFSPHLTVARVKDVGRQESAIIRSILAGSHVAAGSCRVDTVTIFRSRTSQHGAQYERLLRVPLGPVP